MVKIGVLVSGGGTNLQALLDAQTAGRNSGWGDQSGDRQPEKSLRSGAGQNGRGARRWPCPAGTITPRQDYDAALLTALQQAGVELVVLAGFLMHAEARRCCRGYRGRASSMCTPL